MIHNAFNCSFAAVTSGQIHLSLTFTYLLFVCTTRPCQEAPDATTNSQNLELSTPVCLQYYQETYGCRHRHCHFHYSRVQIVCAETQMVEESTVAVAASWGHVHLVASARRLVISLEAQSLKR